MPSRSAPDDTRLVAYAFAFVGVVLAAIIVARTPYDARSAAGVEAVAGVLALVAAGFCAGAARRTRDRARLSWACLGTAMLLWGSNLLLLDLTALFLGSTRGLAVASAMQTVAILLVAASLPWQPREPFATGSATRTSLDVVLMVLCLLLMYSVLVVPRVLDGGSHGFHVFALAYPVVTLGMAILTYSRCRRGDGSPRPDQLLLVVALGCWVVSGSCFAVLANDLDMSPPLVTFVFSLGLVALGAAAHLAGRPHVATPIFSTRVRQVLLALPELLTVVAGVVSVAVGLSTPVDWALLALLCLMFVVRSTRHSLLARRSQEALEGAVAERTAALTRLALRHRRILGTVEDGIVGVDDQGRITFVNTAAERLLGLRPEEARGADACEVLCVDEHVSCPLLDPGATRLETVFASAWSRSVPVDVTIGHESDADDTRAGAVLAFRDLSDRERVEQLKTQFVSSVSHELRTPLTSIRGVVEMLADGDAGELPDAAVALLRTAQRGGERLSRLVDDIIDMERLATGDFGVRPQPTDVRELVRHAIASLETLAAGREVQVRTGHLEGLAQCDPDRVTQALVNLVGNAVKFSPPGADVVVDATETDGEVRVSVRDHGRGIPAQDLPHVFDRFRQVTVTDATDKGGSGLGLTITRSIIERHGGRIWVESEMGRGSLFTFTLPAADVCPAALPLAESAAV